MMCVMLRYNMSKPERSGFRGPMWPSESHPRQSRTLLQCILGLGGTNHAQEDNICIRGTSSPGPSSSRDWFPPPSMRLHSPLHHSDQKRTPQHRNGHHHLRQLHSARTPGRSKRRLRLLRAKRNMQGLVYCFTLCFGSPFLLASCRKSCLLPFQLL